MEHLRDARGDDASGRGKIEVSHDGEDRRQRERDDDGEDRDDARDGAERRIVGRVTKLGYQMPNFTYPGVAPADLFGNVVRQAVEADTSGFDTVMVMDHFYQLPMIGPPEHEMLECYTTLAALAQHTKTARLSALVTGNTYRNPALLAKTVTTLDVVSGGSTPNAPSQLAAPLVASGLLLALAAAGAGIFGVLRGTQRLLASGRSQNFRLPNRLPESVSQWVVGHNREWYRDKPCFGHSEDSDIPYLTMVE